MTMQSGKTHSAAVPVAAEEVVKKKRYGRLLHDFGIYGVLLGVLVAATIAYPGFLGWDSLRVLITQNAPLGIVAVGMTLVIIAGGFDLSVGAIYATAGTVAAGVSIHASVPLGLAAGVTSGVAAGLINGFIVAKLNINPLIATLGTGAVFSGVVLLVTNSQPYSVTDPSFAYLGQSTIAGVPLPMIFVVMTFAAGWVVLNRTIVGRQLLSVGGNREASRLAGIRTTVVVGGAYVASGTLAAFAGVISASQLGVGQGDTGTSLALSAIAIVVIGGTSLLGGEGSVIRTAVGLLIIASLNNLFFSLALNSNWQAITQGVFIIAAVGLDQLTRNRTR